MSIEGNDRLQSELELLHAIYPDQLRYQNRELIYTTNETNLKLRLPDGYLKDEHPEIILANTGKQDLRNETKEIILPLPTGEEILDAIILAFIDLTRSKLELELEHTNERNITAEPTACGAVTIVIWLHHLLNTNKRKQCLSPDASVSGVTKPGYPGVLIYSGPYDAVHEHVRELKQLNWAGFQVRYEIEERWVFRHGEGVVEVEAMKDVVAEVGEKRELFLECMRMK